MLTWLHSWSMDTCSSVHPTHQYCYTTCTKDLQNKRCVTRPGYDWWPGGILCTSQELRFYINNCINEETPWCCFCLIFWITNNNYLQTFVKVEVMHSSLLIHKILLLLKMKKVSKKVRPFVHTCEGCSKLKHKTTSSIFFSFLLLLAVCIKNSSDFFFVRSVRQKLSF